MKESPKWPHNISTNTIFFEFWAPLVCCTDIPTFFQYAILVPEESSIMMIQDDP